MTEPFSYHTEYDPVTSKALTEMVEVGQTGEVTTWTWVQDPRDQSPWDSPHALAMILLDGADTPFLHAVLVEDAAHMKTGMRVSIKWKQETEGHIQDIESKLMQKYRCGYSALHKILIREKAEQIRSSSFWKS